MALDNPISHAGMKYRPDIDGLRAVAVLLVVFFHAGFRVYGGYVGVDVFFVISGYLISSVIMTDIGSGRFSIASFYERRVRRIFPAMLVMLAVTTVLAYRYLVPSEMEDYARSQLAALFSGSNFLFWSQSGYFDDPSATKPLLHTWSLGVEEQFYIFFPPLLLFLRRYAPQRLKAVIWGCAAVSFTAAAMMVPRYPTAAFFFAPLRAWELLIGTILSQKYLPQIRRAVTRNAVAAGGLLMILLAAWKFTERTPFPGVAALLPCLGAGMVIAAGETGGSLVASMLAWRPVVFVGLISYSLYLWHWPLLVFQGTSSMLFPNGTMSLVQKWLFIPIAIVIATLSWAFVERPFRTGRLRPDRTRLWQVNGSVLAVLTLISVGLLVAHGLPDRFPPDARHVAAYTKYDKAEDYRQDSCFMVGYSVYSDFRRDPCLTEHPGKRSILLLGDSHGAQMYAGFHQTFPEDDILQATVAPCRPFLHGTGGPHPVCRQLMEYIYTDFLKTRHVDTVVLVARWTTADFKLLGDTIAYLRGQGTAVVLVGPNIEYDLALPRLLAIALRDGTIAAVPRHRSLKPQQLDETMAHMAETMWHVPYISIYRDLCTPECPLYGAPDVPLLFDTDHFTREGSVLLAEAIRARHQVE